MSEKRQSASPSTAQVKNQRKTIGIEGKLSIIMRRAKGERVVIYAVMLDLLMVSYVQFVIMLTELNIVLSQELKCLFVSYPNGAYQNCGCESLTFLLHYK
jgi:hypothetical protein